ncbi:MAG: cytosolic protein [Enterocloster asparagiformis]|nr:cytosolic protein [Enterocloster asparagiformis]
MKNLIEGAYDLHVHSGPDILPRRMDDIEMAQRVIESGMAGYAIKSHFFCTAERASLINKLYPGCDAIGAVVLNNAVGGINPIAVEMAARAGAKIVWMPTCDSAHEQKLVFGGEHKGKLPYWATLAIRLREEGVKIKELSILDTDGKLTKETCEVLDVIARHDMILESGHLSQPEVFILIKEAARRGVKRMLITHADYPGTYYTIDQQKELVQYGAYIEHCYTTWATKKVDFEETVEQIRAVGPEHATLATDLGQKTAKYPDEGLLEFAVKLYEAGFSEDEIHMMAVTNPRYLLNK